MSASQEPSTFPPRIVALLREVASRTPAEGYGPWEDGNGEPLQDDADNALAWVAARERRIAASTAWLNDALAVLADIRKDVRSTKFGGLQCDELERQLREGAKP